MLKSLILMGFLLTPLMATAENGLVSFMPPNDLHKTDQVDKIANMTEEEFNAITDRFVAVYQAVATRYGARLIAEKNWTDSTVNAFAYQRNNGTEWYIAMFGGLARRDEITADGYAGVVCHELAHHMAGFPVKGAAYWASAEGNSDYWATQACTRKVWAADTEMNARFRETVDPDARAKCDIAWDTEEEQNLCYRSSMAGKSLGTLLAALRGSPPPEFATPDPNVVAQTNVHHPQAQCRLDTYFQGALCTLTHRFNFIPGKGHPAGGLSRQAEHESAANVCYSSDGFRLGVRPACWFRPTL